MAIAEIEKDDTIMKTPWCMMYKMIFPFEVFPWVNNSPVEESAVYRALDYRPIATVCRSPGRYNNKAKALFGRGKYQFRTCVYVHTTFSGSASNSICFWPSRVWDSSLCYNATHSFRVWVKKIIYDEWSTGFQTFILNQQINRSKDLDDTPHPPLFRSR